MLIVLKNTFNVDDFVYTTALMNDGIKELLMHVTPVALLPKVSERPAVWRVFFFSLFFPFR